MKMLPLSEAKAKLSSLIDAVASRDERVTITRNGRAAAVLVSSEEFESWQATIEIMRDPQFLADIRLGLRQLDKGKARTYEEVFAEKRMTPGRAKKKARRR
jgi:antitoxin YefM